MVIKVGDTIPSYTFTYVPYTDALDDQAACGTPAKLNTDEWKGKRVVLVSVPGAFTPGCHVSHTPPFVKRAHEILAKGADVIAFMAANDPFVMSAWGRVVGAKDEILFLSDSNAALASQMGLSVDMTGRGFGVRTARFAMMIHDLKVVYLAVDELKVEKSTADELLANWPGKL